MKKFFEYIQVYLLLAISGMPFFTVDENFVIVLFLISSVLFFRYKKQIDKTFIKILSVILIIVVLQSVTFSYFNLYSTIGLFMRFMIPYFVVKNIGVKILNIFLDWMVFFSITSLIIYSLTYLNPNIYTFLTNKIAPLFERSSGSSLYGYNTNVLIYTLKSFGDDKFNLYRNSGPFWEAGAFGGMLVLSVFINNLIYDKIFHRNNILFYVAILSTLSTGTFIALFSYYTLYLYFKGFKYMWIIPLLALFVQFIFQRYEFINTRITNQLQSVETTSLSDINSRTRLANFYLDMAQATQSPWYGFGRRIETKFDKSADEFSYSEHRNNGVGYLAVTYGFPFMILYFYLIYNSLKLLSLYNNQRKIMAFITLTGIILLGFSQVWFSKSIFILFLYLGIVIKEALYYKNFHNVAVHNHSYS